MALRDWDPTSTPQYQPVAPYQQPTFNGVQPYQAPRYYQGGAADTLAMRAALGVTSPQDNRATQREAVFGQLNAGEHASKVMSDQGAANRGVGAYRSGAQQGSLARIGAGANVARAGAESKIQDDFADAQARSDSEALQMAMGMNNQRNAFGVNNAQFGFTGAANNAANLNRFNQDNSRFAYGADVENQDKKFNNKMNNYNARQDLMGVGFKALGGLFQ